MATDGPRRADLLRWVVIGACFLGSFVVFGLSYSFGVFFEAILTEFGHSRGVTSVAFGVQSLMLYLGGARRSVRHSPDARAWGLVLGLGLVWTSRAASLLALVLAYGVGMGLGMSVLFVVSYATVPRWFDPCSAVMGVATLAFPFSTPRSGYSPSRSSTVRLRGQRRAARAADGGSLFGRSNISAIFGLLSTSLGTAGIISPYVAGVGYETLGTYTPAFVVSRLAALVGAGAVVVAPATEKEFGVTP